LPKRSTAANLCVNYFSENLPIINKTKHPTKGERMEKTRELKTGQTKKPSKNTNSQGNEDKSST
jgi:hypothetical protein